MGMSLNGSRRNKKVKISFFYNTDTEGKIIKPKDVAATEPVRIPSIFDSFLYFY